MCQTVIVSEIGFRVRAAITGSDLAADYLVNGILGKTFVDLFPYIYSPNSLLALMFIG